MNGRYFVAPVLALGVAALLLNASADAQKGKTPPDVPGTFTMRSAYDPGGAGPDRASGDAIDLGVYHLDGDGTGVVLNGNREFRAELFVTRYAQLDFSEAIAGTGCATGCFRTFGQLVIPTPNIYPPEGPWRVVMQTNVVTIANVETADGLMGLREDGPAGYARFFISFKDPGGRDFHWSVLYNPSEYQGSHLARVLRTAPCSWMIYADGPNARGGLRAWSVRKGRNSNSDEGLFSMPFGIAFSAPNCGA